MGLKNSELLQRSMLFHGLSEEDVSAALEYLRAEEKKYRKGTDIIANYLSNVGLFTGLISSFRKRIIGLLAKLEDLPPNLAENRQNLRISKRGFFVSRNPDFC